MKQRGLFLACIFITSLAVPAHAREQIRIVGSSTVYPFVTIAAEQFGMDDDYATPIVESTGTGGGFKLFCSGVGEAYPDINNASRPITESEIALCAKNGVHQVFELAIGFDGIVIGNSTKTKHFSLSIEQLFAALARELPDAKGRLMPNPHKTWRDIAPNLPDTPIIIYGPPPTSGTRDAFVELVMHKGCEAFPAFETTYPDKKAREKHCGLMREDGAFIEAGEDDNLIVQKLVSNQDALGILGFAFYEESHHKIQASTINGVLPDSEAIENGSYGISRSLFVYLKKEHTHLVSGLGAFGKELVSEGAIGSDGYLILNGLIPIPKAQREEIREKVNSFNLKQ